MHQKRDLVWLSVLPVRFYVCLTFCSYFSLSLYLHRSFFGFSCVITRITHTHNTNAHCVSICVFICMYVCLYTRERHTRCVYQDVVDTSITSPHRRGFQIPLAVSTLVTHSGIKESCPPICTSHLGPGKAPPKIAYLSPSPFKLP